MLSLKTCHFGKMEVIFQKMEFTNSHFHHLECLTVLKHDYMRNVCEHTCSEIIFVYDTVLVDIHKFEALPVHFKLVIRESTRPFAGPLALALTHDASPFTRQTLILTTADT